jgi:hypothetical protein
MYFKFTPLFSLVSFIICCCSINAQVIINEGCNKNYVYGIDEEGENEDWIELMNAGGSTVDLSDYYLSDKSSEPTLWPLNGISLEPNEFVQIYCSEKNRYSTAPFSNVLNALDYAPIDGWNTHDFTTAYEWDGVSNIVINICSYSNVGYTENSVFKQTATPYVSTVGAFNDGSDASCSAVLGTMFYQRPNMQLNGITIGDGDIVNSPYDYPAPYGNWYWSARHQILIRADELLAAGVTAGPINSIAFEVVSSYPVTYSYIDISIISTANDELSETMSPISGFQNHTNFKIDSEGETIYLFDNAANLISALEVESPRADVAIGRSPDNSDNLEWLSPTPGATNNTAIVYTDTLTSPLFSVPSGIVSSSFNLTITNPNPDVIDTKIVYTLDGSEPVFGSTTYSGSPISINEGTVVRAKIFPVTAANYLPSFDTYGTYLFNIEHSTPILLVTTDNSNLYGPDGIFDNYNSDWVKAAHLTYLTKEEGHPALFETRTAMRMDGGAGGSRSNPQHSFRLTFDHNALGEQTINEQLIPNIPFRNSYSDIYLRNGSNQWLTFPHKDACQVSMMSNGTNNYYSAMEPVSVYINGEYFGLYELREKFNTEYFDERENVDKDSIEILSLSYFYNLVLRALEGDVNNFYNDYALFDALNPDDTSYMTQADKYFDLAHYTDYIIGESWMGNTDWPGNNIKIYRSNTTDFRWRFALIDLELSLNPNGWTTCTFNHIQYMQDQSPDNPFINIWLQSIQNEQYTNQFINRYADLMNTSYLTDTLLAISQEFYNKMVVEMPNEYERWGDPFNVDGQMDDFESNHEKFQQQLACRNDQVRGDILSAFDLDKEVTVQLAVFPDSSGSIQLNTIHPQVYPWSGIYFDGVPIKMTAIPDSGYMFVNWMPNPLITDTLNPILETNVDLDTTTFTAVFKLIPPPPDGDTIHFTLYPSPSSGLITIEHDNNTLAENAELVIFDLHGRMILADKLNADAKTITIDISALAPAIYYVRVLNGNEVMETLSFVRM